MAPVIVGGPGTARLNPTARLTAATGATGSSNRVVTNAGALDGELLIAIQSQTAGTTAAMTAPSTVGFEWTQRGSTGGSASVGWMKVWYRTASNETSTWTFGGDGNGVVTVLVITNWDSRGETYAWDFEPTFATGTATATQNAPSLTLARTNDLAICGFAAETSGGTHSGYPGSFVEVKDTAATTNSQSVATGQTGAAGVTGAIGSTYSTTSDFVTVSLAISSPPNYSTSSGSPSVTKPHWSTAADTLVAIVAANSAGADGASDCMISAVTDNAHNVWTEAVTDFVVGYDGTSPQETTAVRLSIWYCAGAAAVREITATATQTCDTMAMTILESSGVTNVSPMDSGFPTHGNDSDDLAVVVSGTNSTAATLIVAAAATGNSTGTFNVTTAGSFTELDQVDTAESLTTDDTVLRSSYRITTVGAVQSTTWTLSTAGNEVHAMIALKSGSVVTTNPNANWPAMVHEIAFGYDPNDPTDVATWTTVTTRVESLNTRRGRSYELARTEAGEADVQLRNNDGALDPGNTGSAYYPNVKVFTPYRCRATWNGLVYPLFTGYVERWPQQWDNQFGQSPLVAVDGLATLSATRLIGTLGAEILADAPYGYWPLDDGRLALTAANKSTSHTEILSAVESANLGGTGFFGSNLDLVGEESTCWEQQIYDTVSPSIDSQYGVCLSGTLSTGVTLANGVLFEIWARVQATSAARTYALMALKSSAFASDAQHRVCVLRIDTVSGLVTVDVTNSGGTIESFPTAATAKNDGVWHHYVVHLVDDPSVECFVDGVQVLNDTPASTVANTIDRVLVGGMADEWSDQWFTAGLLAHAALFEVSTADERRVAVQANAGVTGFPEKSGARIARLLNYANWNAGRSVDEGLSLLGGASTIARQTLLQAVQDVGNWENGLVFVDGSGTFRFVDRQHRFDRVKLYTFGDDETAGEIPYETDVEIEFDPKYVFNDVSITRAAGKDSSGSGTAHKRDNASINSYFTRNQDKTSGVASISQCLDEATWTLENYAQPRMRLGNISITPSANPDLWPVALSVEIGDRITIKRRPFGGATITLDCYVEQVAHRIVPNSWVTTYSLSPALLTTYEGASGWILNASELDTDTYLGV